MFLKFSLFFSVVGQGALGAWPGFSDASKGEDGAEGNGNDLLQYKPKTDVAAVLAAAAATANFETSESSSKRRKQAAEELKQQEEEIAAAEASSAPMIIGSTVTGHSMVTQSGKQKMKFIPPIYLASLERRKMRTQKKLVPLIEPDICNYVHIDFLPRTLLRLSGDKLDISLSEVQQEVSGQQVEANAVTELREDIKAVSPVGQEREVGSMGTTQSGNRGDPTYESNSVIGTAFGGDHT